MEQLAEIRPGLTLGGVGPELEGQAAPAQGNTGIKCEVREEALEPRRRKLVKRLAVEANRRGTQEADAQLRCRRVLVGQHTSYSTQGLGSPFNS
jgi:hypothetical protein